MDSPLKLRLGLALLPLACLASPAIAQTVTPSSGVWSTSTNGSTVTTSTSTQGETTFPPYSFSFTQPTGSGSYPATVNATLMNPGTNSSVKSYFNFSIPIYQFTGVGTQGSTSSSQQGYIVGPNFAASISAGARSLLHVGEPKANQRDLPCGTTNCISCLSH